MMRNPSVKNLSYFCLTLLLCLSFPTKAFDEADTFAVQKRIPIKSKMSGHLDLYRFYNEWFLTPYKLGGNSKAGIDCSAFVQRAFRAAFQTKLPRTTKQQSRMGWKISPKRLTQGDLVFFKLNKKTRHVGIYLGGQHFMHASTSKGVIISKLDSPFWQKSFTQARRIKNLDVKTKTASRQIQNKVNPS